MEPNDLITKSHSPVRLTWRIKRPRRHPYALLNFHIARSITSFASGIEYKQSSSHYLIHPTAPHGQAFSNRLLTQRSIPRQWPHYRRQNTKRNHLGSLKGSYGESISALHFLKDRAMSHGSQTICPIPNFYHVHLLVLLHTAPKVERQTSIIPHLDPFLNQLGKHFYKKLPPQLNN